MIALLQMAPYHLAKTNKNKIEKLKQRAIVFIIPEGPLEGPQNTEIRFPWSGKITSVIASCVTTGTNDVILQVETVPLEQFEEESWSVAVENIVIPAERKLNNSAFTITNPNLNANDFVRIVVGKAGGGIRDLSIEVLVELNT